MNSPLVQLMCPNLKCRRILGVPAADRGKTVRCAGCGARMQVPMGGGRAAPKAPGPKRV